MSEEINIDELARKYVEAETKTKLKITTTKKETKVDIVREIFSIAPELVLVCKRCRYAIDYVPGAPYMEARTLLRLHKGLLQVIRNRMKGEKTLFDGQTFEEIEALAKGFFPELLIEHETKSAKALHFFGYIQNANDSKMNIEEAKE